MISNEELKKIEKKALKRDIPVMQKEGIDFMCQRLNEMKAKRLLEIGSAIGYSAMYLVTNVDGLVVETIERDEDRYLEAKENIEKYDLADKIILHEADALEFDDLKLNDFDCLFIDAAKAQYQKFFEKYIPFVKEEGIVIVDNLDFHGMIYDIDHIHNRNTKQLVKKIKRFKDWIFNHDDYNCEYFEIGDGIVVIERKRKDETDCTVK